MGTRLFYHSRNGSATNGSLTAYSPLPDERAVAFQYESEKNLDFGSSPLESLIGIGESLVTLRESKSSLCDPSGGFGLDDGCETHIRLADSPSDKLSHSRHSSSSSIRDFPSSQQAFPDEKMKTLKAFGFLVLGLFATTLSLATVHDRMPMVDPLPDVIFSLVPQWDFGLSLSEYVIMICLYPTFILITLHRHRWIIWRRVFVIVGLLYLGRSVTMLVTSVPKANNHYYCAEKSNTSFSPTLILSRALTLMTGLGMSINGKHIYCGDYIYSGHTCMLVLSALIYGEYLPRKGLFIRTVRYFFYFCSTLGIVLVCISRGHYTVDVVIAYVVTTLVFWIYHTVAGYPQLKIPSQTNHLSKMWWFNLIIYFEKNVPEGKLPVRFNYPFPWYPFPWPKKLLHWKLDCAE